MNSRCILRSNLVETGLQDFDSLLLGDGLPVSNLVLVLGDSVDEIVVVLLGVSVLQDVGESYGILQGKEGNGESNNDEQVC